MPLPALAYDSSWPRTKVLHKRFNDGSQASPTESGGQGWLGLEAHVHPFHIQRPVLALQPALWGQCCHFQEADHSRGFVGSVGAQGRGSGLLPASPGKGSHRIGPRGEETPKSPVGAELLTSHSLGYSSFLPLGPG